MQRPAESEYAPFYSGYVALVPESDPVAALAAQRDVLRATAGAVGPETERHRYAPGKWSVRELFGHLTDAERVFGYRAFCISRGEQAALPGMDEKAYMAASRFDEQPLAELAGELLTLREANLLVLRRLRPEDWERAGNANGTPVTVRALAYIIAGHVRHHLGVLRERYGIDA